MRKLLIAQHSKSFADYLRQELQESWNVQTCIGSRPVIDAMQYMQPEAMILDLNLDPKDGITILKEGQSLLPQTIIATSNYVDNEIIDKLESLGVRALVRFPFRVRYIKKSCRI